MKNKRHIIIGSIIFIVNTPYNFFADGWFYHYYYAPAVKFLFLKKVVIIVFILTLLLKWTKLLLISKRYIYIYAYYAIIVYSSGMLGDILGIFFAGKLRRMGF